MNSPAWRADSLLSHLKHPRRAIKGGASAQQGSRVAVGEVLPEVAHHIATISNIQIGIGVDNTVELADGAVGCLARAVAACFVTWHLTPLETGWGAFACTTWAAAGVASACASLDERTCRKHQAQGHTQAKLRVGREQACDMGRTSRLQDTNSSKHSQE